jgi:hypothetical protein
MDQSQLFCAVIDDSFAPSNSSPNSQSSRLQTSVAKMTAIEDSDWTPPLMAVVLDWP